MARRILTFAVICLLGLILSLGPAALEQEEPIFPEITFRQVVLDPPPLQADGHILVSAGDFLPLAGGSADWYKNRGLLRGSQVAVVTPGNLVVDIAGETRRLAVPPVLVDGKLYIPLSLALEVLGLPGYGGVAGAAGPGNTSAKGGTAGPGSIVRAGEAAGQGPTSAGPDVYLPPLKARDGVHFRYYPVYNLQAGYDPERGEIRGELLLAYQNPYPEPLRRLYFNLPANAPYGNGAQLTVQRVAVNNRPAPFNLRGSSLEVFLSRSLAPRETLSLDLSFTTRVPEGGGRLGFSGDTLTVAGWYPILAPRTGKAPAGVATTSYGDPYFAPAAYYQVRLALPSGYQVLASSRATGRQEMDGRTTWTFNSEYPIREFAFAAATGWRFTTRQAGAVRLTVASRDEPAAASLEMASQALAFFQATYGPYPYSYLNLAFVPLDNLAGMEYPGLILLSNYKTYSPSTVVHEVAHQWWYNLVGNDSCRAAWIDEGLAEYSTLLFYRSRGPAMYQARLAEVERLAGQVSSPVNLSLEEYGNEQAYRQAVYSRGAKFWLAMEAAAGTAGLQQALAYIQQYYRYEIVPPQGLLTILTYYGRLQPANFTPFLRN